MNDDNLGKTMLALELELLSPPVRTSSEHLDQLLAVEFVEFGASGRIFDKNAMIAMLRQSTSSVVFQVNNFRLLTSGEHEVLATYTLGVRSNAGDVLRKSNRSSLWARREGRWQLLFHQGTKSE